MSDSDIQRRKEIKAVESKLSGRINAVFYFALFVLFILNLLIMNTNAEKEKIGESVKNIEKEMENLKLEKNER